MVIYRMRMRCKIARRKHKFTYEEKKTMLSQSQILALSVVWCQEFCKSQNHIFMYSFAFAKL